MKIFDFKQATTTEVIKEGFVKIQLPLGVSLGNQDPNYCKMGGDVYTYNTLQSLCKNPSSTLEYNTFNSLVINDSEPATHGAYTYYIKKDLLPEIDRLKAEGNYFANSMEIVEPHRGLQSTSSNEQDTSIPSFDDHDNSNAGILDSLNYAWDTVYSYFSSEGDLA